MAANRETVAIGAGMRKGQGYKPEASNTEYLTLPFQKDIWYGHGATTTAPAFKWLVPVSPRFEDGIVVSVGLQVAAITTASAGYKISSLIALVKKSDGTIVTDATAGYTANKFVQETHGTIISDTDDTAVVFPTGAGAELFTEVTIQRAADGLTEVKLPKRCSLEIDLVLLTTSVLLNSVEISGFVEVMTKMSS